MSSKKKSKKNSTAVATEEEAESTSSYVYPSLVDSRPLKAFSKTGRMLRDSEVAEFLSTLTSTNEDFYPITPMPYEQFMTSMSSLEHSAALNLTLAGINDNKYAVLIVNRHNHWYVILFHIKNKSILVVDPLGPNSETGDCHSETVDELVSVLQTTVSPFLANSEKTAYDVEARCLGIQTDKYNCGIWALEIARKFIKYQDFSKITTRRLSKINIKAWRTYWSTLKYGS